MHHFHCFSTDFSMSTSFIIQSHVAALFILLSELSRYDYSAVVPFAIEFKDYGVLKWASQFCNFTDFSVSLTCIDFCWIQNNFFYI